jgi:4-amino-4-deoxy-L-arabinose transferase-like glycosyltransferase
MAWAGQIAVALLGIAAVLLATHWGPGLTNDSGEYIAAARRLLAGNGLVNVRDGVVLPFVHYPPLFPFALVPLGWLGLDPLIGARWLNALLFGATLIVMGWILREPAGRPGWTSGIAGISAIACLDLLRVYSMAWSEPLCFVLGFFGLGALCAHLHEARTRLLFAAGIAIGLAFVTRYAAGAFVATGVLALLVLGDAVWRKRLRDLGIFGVASLGPMLLWMLRNRSVSGAAIDREVGLHPIDAQGLKRGVDTIAGWLLLESPHPVVTLALVLGIAAGVVVAISRRPAEGRVVPSLVALFAGIYAAAILVSISFFDRATPLDYRLLSPVLIAVLILVLDAARGLARTQRTAVALALLAAWGLLFAGHATQTTKWVSETHAEGQVGFSNRAWTRSLLIAKLRALPPETPLVSNGAYPIDLLTGRRATQLPSKLEKESFPEKMLAVRKVLLEQNGRLVWFHSIPWPETTATESELRSWLPLRVVEATGEGVIYAAAGSDGKH